MNERDIELPQERDDDIVATYCGEALTRKQLGNTMDASNVRAAIKKRTLLVREPFTTSDGVRFTI